MTGLRSSRISLCMLRLLAAVLLLMCVYPAAAHARDITVAMPLLPSLVEIDDSGTPRGIYIDMLTAMDEAYPEGTFSFLILPYMRAKEYVGTKADILFPFAWTPAQPMRNSVYRFSDVTIYSAKFFLYYNTHYPITPEQARSGNYRIETDITLMEAYPFVNSHSVSIESSLRKLEKRRIDGFIFAAQSTNTTLNVLKMKGWKNADTIASTPFDIPQVKFILPADERGEALNTLLNTVIGRLHASGKLEAIMAPLNAYYQFLP